MAVADLQIVHWVQNFREIELFYRSAGKKNMSHDEQMMTSKQAGWLERRRKEHKSEQHGLIWKIDKTTQLLWSSPGENACRSHG